MRSSLKLASWIAAVFFILPFDTFGQQSEIVIGDKMADTQSQLHKLDAADISTGIELEPSDNGLPRKGVYWRISAFKCVIALLAREGRITAISYWSEKDFSQSKVHRETSQLYARSIVFDSTDNRLSVNQLPGYELYGWSSDSQNWNFSLFDDSVSRNRTAKEIQNPKYSLLGLPSLEKQLSQLPIKTVVTLSPMPDQLHRETRYPSRAIVNELRQFLTPRDMTLRVIQDD